MATKREPSDFTKALGAAAQGVCVTVGAVIGGVIGHPLAGGVVAAFFGSYVKEGVYEAWETIEDIFEPKPAA